MKCLRVSKIINTISNKMVQPWWLGSLARYLSHSVEEVHLAIGGLNPAWGMVPHSGPANHRLVLYGRVSCKAAHS